ncbi:MULTISPECIES: NAD(P)H-dependent oxidoreductase [Streptacidiphilus]|uniref:NAD(P)H-dependent oxidoreductase n=1 Tax=Streptacidiphilus cavernicola TaxID=3342716 RepID=A0ABV6UYE3_9ACTN|nr:NAD(P)H-dependent oxidoreductase [Streptacidiphilus jeojiense]
MNVLIVHAHPDPHSLTASLKDLAVEALRADGHEVVVSDLYAMKWQAAAGFDDFDGITGPDFMHASGTAYGSGRLAQDIRVEQQKLLDADLVVLHFPLWWFTVPAILKGWIDRVFCYDFAYGAGIPRYGAGPFAGKRAMVATTVGGRAGHYTDRGVNGPIADLLFPINHGVLFFTGFDVLPPFVEPSAVHLDDRQYSGIADRYRRRLATAFTAEPIRYRPESGGDYTGLTHPDGSELAPGTETPDSSGFALHTAGPDRP